MTIREYKPINSHELASDLARQMETIKQRRIHLVEVEARIQAFERRYGVASSDLHAAIESGELQETAEVCEWIIDYELLQRAAASGPS